MADAPETPTPETPATPTDQTSTESTAPTSTKTLAPADALWAAVKDAATTKGLAVRELVIGELTNLEIIKRKEAVLAVLTKYDEKTKELKKQEKPAPQGLAKVEFDSEGKVIRTYYDAEGSKALKAIRDEIEKISTALAKFFDNNDVSKLFELAGKK